MTYKEFKKEVLTYFKQHKFSKKEFVFDNSLENHNIYSAYFTLNNRKLELSYIDGVWRLNENRDGGNIYNMEKTLNECCDYLWKIKRC